MLGQPVSMLIPQVVGFKLHGQLPEGATATDLVLTVTRDAPQEGRRRQVRRVLRRRPGRPAAGRPRHHRQHGPRVRRDLRHLPRRRRDAALPAAHRPAGVAGRSWSRRTARNRACSTRRARPRRSTPTRWSWTWRRSSRAWPGRRGRRTACAARENARRRSREALPAACCARPSRRPTAPDRCRRRRRSRGGHNGETIRSRSDPWHGSVVIAAITSCTNTSNPSVMIAAGLLAKKAVERGLQTQAVGEDQPGPRVEGRDRLPDRRRADAVAGDSSASTSSATAAPPASATAARCREPIAQAIDDNDLVVAAVLSGNRNFEGRVHPRGAGQLPRLAAAGRRLRPGRPHGHRPGPGAARQRRQGQAGVPEGHLADASRKCRTPIDQSRQAGDVPQGVRRGLRGRRALAELCRCRGRPVSAGTRKSTYVKHPPYFEGMTRDSRRRSADINGARVLALLGDSITTDHISPAGSIKTQSPAGKYLIEHGVEPKDFNSYGARRGNHEVMVRGTFANVRLRNQLAPGTEGGVTRHLPGRRGRCRSSTPPMKYQARRRAAGRPGGQGIRLRLLARLGRQGAACCWASGP